MVPALMAGQMALDYMENARAKRERKKQAAAGILQSNAASLKAPTYGVQAAQAQHQNRLGDQNLARQSAGRLAGYLSSLGSGGAAGAPVDPLAQDYENNPQYVGSKVSGPGTPNGGPAAPGPAADMMIPEYQLPRLKNPWE